VVPDQIGVDVDGGSMRFGDGGLQAGLGAVERGIAGGAEIEAVVDVVANG
jgi:hypothetical protein